MPDKELTPEEEAQSRELLRFVKPWMRFRKLSQKDMAADMNVSEATVSKWLSGKQAMTMAQFSAICRLLKTAPENVGAGPPDGLSRRRLVDKLARGLTTEQIDVLIAVAEQFARQNTR